MELDTPAHRAALEFGILIDEFEEMRSAMLAAKAHGGHRAVSAAAGFPDRAEELCRRTVQLAGLAVDMLRPVEASRNVRHALLQLAQRLEQLLADVFAGGLEQPGGRAGAWTRRASLEDLFYEADEQPLDSNGGTLHDRVSSVGRAASNWLLDPVRPPSGGCGSLHS